MSRAIPPLYIFMYLALAGTFIGVTAGTRLPGVEMPISWLILLIMASILIVGLAFIIYQTYLSYERRTYDPTWTWRFQSKFDRIARHRLAAATVLKEKRDILSDIKRNQETLEEIDEVLDFFEDVGFYMQGDYVTPEAAHHQFYHWLRGYWLSAKPYVDARRALESAVWENVENLFIATNEIEYGYPRRITEEQFNDDERDRFLVGEMNSAKALLENRV